MEDGTASPLFTVHAYVEDVEYLLDVRGLNPRRDDRRMANRYNILDAVGWKIDLPTDVGVRRVDLVLPPLFPFAAARIGVDGMPEDQLPIAHVEAGWLLCLSAQDERLAITSDVNAIADVLDRAARLLATPREELLEQRRREFVNYWEIGATGKAIVALISTETPFGTITVWNGTHFTLVTDSDEMAKTWLSRHFATEFRSGSLKRGVYLPGENIEEQLNSAAMLVNIAEPYPHAKELLVRAARRLENNVVAVFRLQGDFALVGGRIHAPNKPKTMKRSQLLQGFRNGRAPAKIAVPVYFGEYSIFERASLQRADAPWVFARGGESFDAGLQAASVCLIGAGALGSGIARLLVNAGVGHVKIIDPDALRFGNIARHDLGAEYIGESKARALAIRLMRAYPFVEVHGIDKHWQNAYLEDDTVFDCNLVLSTTASWPAEAQLNAFFRDEKIATPLAFGWIEAHASAAHMLVTMPTGGCMSCGFTAKGEFIRAVTEWDVPTLKSEPACGTSYAPYSNLAAMRAQAMIAQQAIAVLKGEVRSPQLTTEIYDRSLRAERGGKVTEEAVKRLGHEPSDFIERWMTEWPKNPECTWCRT